jgi:hypothetical protein
MKFVSDFSFTGWPHRAQGDAAAPPPPPPPPETWSPDALFSQGAVGAWYDPSDLGSLFQDVAGTVPVTGVGQQVAMMRDKSGNGTDMLQPTLEKRPTYETDGALHWLAFDGVDDFMSVPLLDLSATDKITIFTGLSMQTNGTVIYLEFSTNSNSNTGTFWSGRTVANSYRAISRGSATISAAQGANSAAAFPPPTPGVVTSLHDIAANLTRIRIDGAQSGTDATGNKGSGAFAAEPLYLGMRGGSSFPFQGRIHGMILFGALATASELTDAETFLASKTGTTS